MATRLVFTCYYVVSDNPIFEKNDAKIVNTTSAGIEGVSTTWLHHVNSKKCQSRGVLKNGISKLIALLNLSLSLARARADEQYR